MNLDGLTLSVLTRELIHHIKDGQIQKLYQIDKTTLLFKIHTQQNDIDLIITVGSTPAMYLSLGIKDLPKEPTSLCMFLRKNIEGSRITTIEQLNGDRIFCITTDKLELNGSIQSTKIYVELMGKYSNCIFVQNDIILESLVHVTPLMNRERSIVAKIPYELPPNTNRVSLFDFNEDELVQLFKSFSQDTLEQTIRTIFNGFGKSLLDEFISRTSFTKEKPMNELSDRDFHQLGNTLYTLAEEIQESSKLYAIQINGKKIVHSPIPLSFGDTIHIYENLSEPIGESIKAAGAIHTADKELEKIITNAIKKEELRHKKIQKELDDTDKIATYKLYGDLLMIHSYLENPYKKEVTLNNILDENPLPLTIPLQPQLSIVENGQWYYKLYRKLKNRITSGAYQLNMSTTKLQYLSSILYSLSLATDRDSLQEIRNECMDASIIKKSKKPLSYKLGKSNYIKLSVDGSELFIGRNNQQNDYLTHRFAKPNDMWFHAQDIQGSHLILRTDHEPDDMLLSTVAQYAAFYSKGRNSSKVPVDYTLIKNIKKPPGSPLGFVIFSTHQTMIVEPKEPPQKAK